MRSRIRPRRADTDALCRLRGCRRARRNAPPQPIAVRVEAERNGCGETGGCIRPSLRGDEPFAETVIDIQRSRKELDVESERRERRLERAGLQQPIPNRV